MVDITPASVIAESNFTTWTLVWSITDSDTPWNNAVIDEVGGVVYLIGPGGGAGGTLSSFKTRKIIDGTVVTQPLDVTPTTGLVNVGYTTNRSIRSVYVATRAQDNLSNNGWIVVKAGTRIFSKLGSGATTDNALQVIAISQTGLYILTIEGASKQAIKFWQGS